MIWHIHNSTAEYALQYTALWYNTAISLYNDSVTIDLLQNNHMVKSQDLWLTSDHHFKVQDQVFFNSHAGLAQGR